MCARKPAPMNIENGQKLIFVVQQYFIAKGLKKCHLILWVWSLRKFGEE